MKNSSKLAAIIILIITAFLLGLDMGMSYDEDKVTYKEDKNLELSHLVEVWNVINQKYFEKSEIEKHSAVNYAIKGVVSSLNDPYSMYLTKDEFKEFSSALDSEIQGIGSTVSMEDGFIIIESPLKSSPAQEAGLQPKDRIVAINGESTEGLSVQEAVKKIRGKKGTIVKLTIVRSGKDEAFEVSIVRDRIQLESVTHEKLMDGMFYISINQFSDDTQKEFYEAAQAALLEDARGIILDLRFNGGGYLQIAENLLSYFIGPNKVALQILDSDLNSEQKITNGKSILEDIPLVVLINRGSASASEIVAGSLQDYEKAILVGEQTFGKGTIQQLLEFENGSSLKLTIAKWLTSNARDVNEIGLEPDYEITITETDILNNYDSQLAKAKEVLRSIMP